MTKTHYGGVIRKTLRDARARGETDSLRAAREVLNNLGTAFPSGTCFCQNRNIAKTSEKV